jgi:DNA polymerase
MEEGPMKLSIHKGSPQDDPPLNLRTVVHAEELSNAYDAYRAIDELSHLRDEPGIQFVGGEGSLDAPVMIIGEAPGEVENEQGRPFVGPSGVLLRKQLHRIGLTEYEVFLTNVVKYRPPGNRTPLYFEVELSRACLDEEIRLIQPDLVILAGRTPLSLIHHNGSITEHQGKPIMFEERLWLPIFHPSAALRDDTTMEAFRASFDLIGALISG